MDREGAYTVISIARDHLICERPNGERCEGDAIVKARIYQNILAEQGRTPARQAMRQRRMASGGQRLRHYTHAEVFPIIKEVIEASASPDYFSHAAIVRALMDHAEARPRLEQLRLEDPQHKSVAWWASNMLDFFSKLWTESEGRAPVLRGLTRQRLAGQWAYHVDDLAEGGTWIQTGPRHP